MSTNLRVTPLRCGTLDWPAADLRPGGTGRTRLVVWSFLIEHPAGTVLFDTGMHPAVRDDPLARLGAMAASFGLGYGPADDVASRLIAGGVDPTEVDIVVASHLHWDHCGGNILLPHARVVVQQREWTYAIGPGADPGGYLRADFDTGQDLQLVEGEHDLFGDGRVVCLPTFGHTPGHQSLRLRFDRHEVVLAADACMLAGHLADGEGASFDWDAARQRVVLDGLARRRAAGAVVVCGHDELDAAGRVVLAPEPPPAATHR